MSADTRHEASIVLVDPGGASAERQVEVLLCDDQSNCDVVFVGPVGSLIAVSWQGKAKFTIASKAGAIPAPGSVFSIKSGRPAVQVTRQDAVKPSREGSAWLPFVEAECTVYPPFTQIITTQ